jgi:hypothetical protein
MQFKNPEIFYFLFLLLIPILIHLFHLQKFKKVAFTNVKFLKEIELETRKSSKLKKLLILLSRLLTMVCLILAFAQPYINNNEKKAIFQRIIYLDNSLSMQAKDKGSGDQLQINKNLLIDGIPENDLNYTLITNEKIQENLNYNLLKKALLAVNFHPIKKEINQVLLETSVLQKKSPEASYDVLLISDFQDINGLLNYEELNPASNYHLVTSPINKLENISIDSVWIVENKNQEIKLRTLIRSYEMDFSDLSISLFLEDKLYGKTTLSLKSNEFKEVDFSFPSSKDIGGRISLTDHRLKFDNELFFNIPEKIKTKVLVIGAASDYLKRIYMGGDFELNITAPDQLEQSVLMDQNLIVLNELNKISNALIQSLKSFVKENGNLVIIPALDSDISSYNDLLGAFQSGEIIRATSHKKRVTRINYDHPFFSSVFAKEIFNFQYPIAQPIFETKLKRAASLLLFEDQEGFVFEIPYFDNKIYWIASPLSNKENNFTDSPLIVPLFLNFSLQKTTDESIYLSIGNKNNVIVQSENFTDEPLKLVKGGIEFIPLQTKRNTQINISTEEFPLQPGVYSISNRMVNLKKLAYNYDREESNLTLNDMKALENKRENVHFFSSTSEAIKDVNDSHNNQNLWQLFIILALVFLILEILLQKFLKT